MTHRTAVAAVLAMCFAASTAHAQTLAEFARKERARRTSAQQAQPITNETLVKMGIVTKSPETPRSEALKPAEPPASSSPAAKTTAAAEGESAGHDEKWWRAQFAAAREDVSRAEAEAKSLDSQLKKANTEFLIRSDIYNKEAVMVPLLNSLKSDSESAVKRTDDARKKIVDLEEELRKSGGLPGWAR